MSEVNHNIGGSIVAIITPFDKDNKFDKNTYKKLIERQISSGTHGIVPVGTTGESPVLDFDEHDEVIASAIEFANKRVPVIAGTGANSTLEAIEVTIRAQKMGADAALVVAPYYNKPNQEALYRHYKELHDKTDIPIILYNVPSRTASDILPDTVSRLSKLERIVGIKDATGILERFSAHRALCDDGFILLSGEDGSALGASAHGSHGCISVTANIAPELCSEFQNALTKGDFKTALSIQDKLYPLHEALFCESNPSPVKFALSSLGLCENSLRLPLIPVSKDSETKVLSAIKRAGINK